MSEILPKSSSEDTSKIHQVIIFDDDSEVRAVVGNHAAFRSTRVAVLSRLAVDAGSTQVIRYESVRPR